MSDSQHAAWLRYLEEETQHRVSDTGCDPVCNGGCRMIGRECPPGWCEAVYQKLRLRRDPTTAGQRAWTFLTKPRFSFLYLTVLALIDGIVRELLK